MRILGSVFVVLLIATASWAQTYTFQPKWKVGTEKTITIIRASERFLPDSIPIVTTDTSSFSLKVASETEDQYFVELNDPSITKDMLAILNGYDGVEILTYTPILAVNKKTGEATLNNWTELEGMIEKRLAYFVEQARKGDKKSPFAGLMVEPVKKLVSDNNDLQQQILSNVSYLMEAYGEEWKQGVLITKEITEEVSNENPILQRPLTADVVKNATYTLTEVDEKGQTSVINKKVETDMSNMVTAMEDMMKQFTGSFGVSDSTLQNQVEKMNMMSVKMTQTDNYFYDMKSTWTTRVESVHYTNTPYAGISGVKTIRTTYIVE